MLEKFLVLLERFVVAHELIAANSKREVFEATLGETANSKREVSTEALEKAIKAPYGETEKEVKAAPKKATPKNETKKKAAKPEVDLSELREEIKTMAEAIVEEDDDQCTDEFDDMMDEYEVRNINKIHDEDIVEFHAELKKLVARYFEIKD